MAHLARFIIADLTDPAYWQLVHASEFQTYEQILPQTVLGLFNSSQGWKDWALQNIPDSRSWMAVGFVTGCGTGSAEYGVVRQSAPVQVDAVERVHGGTAVLRCGPRPDAGE